MSMRNKTQELLIEKAFLLAEKTCRSPWVLNYSIPLPGVPIDFHELMTILAAVACIINTLLSLFLIFGHLFHWTKPMEQKQFVRIITYVPFFSLCAFFSIWFYPGSGYIAPWAQYYEGFAITASFLLYVQYVTPDESTREQFFHGLERRWGMTSRKKNDKGSLRWFHGIWIMVFQVTFTRIATILGQQILYGLTCPLSLARSRGQTAITVIQGFSTGVAVSGVIMFESRMHEALERYGCFFKLVSFKGVVGLEAIQSIIFPVLAETQVFKPKPPYYVSWNDFAKGLPQFILVWEMTIVAIMFLRSFSFQPYLRDVRRGVPVSATAGSAFLASFSPVDIIRGVRYMFTPWSRLPRNAEARPSYVDDASGKATNEPELTFNNAL